MEGEDDDGTQTHGDDNRTPDTAIEALEDVQHLGIVPPIVQAFDPDLSPAIDETDAAGPNEGRDPEVDESD